MKNFNIFYLENENDLNSHALEIFRYQWEHCSIYRKYCDIMGCDPSAIKHFTDVPFLPVSFFKTHDVISGSGSAEKIFLSSGTTGMERSRHQVLELSLYRVSLKNGFEWFYGPLTSYDIFALMPSPEENPASSLIFMVNEWIRESGAEVSGFYLHDQKGLAEMLRQKGKRKKLVIGLSYALLDFAEQFPGSYDDTVFMETGGMKGRRKEMVRKELHDILCHSLNTDVIHSEYGMTELLSQAYSSGNGIFRSPPWMKVLIRDMDDPLEWAPHGRTGGISVIDLVNCNSCSFLALQDLGRMNKDGSFEVLGRFDDSDIRGCNLMVI